MFAISKLSIKISKFSNETKVNAFCMQWNCSIVIKMICKNDIGLEFIQLQEKNPTTILLNTGYEL